MNGDSSRASSSATCGNEGDGMRERLESIVDRRPPEDSGIAAQVVLPALPGIRSIHTVPSTS